MSERGTVADRLANASNVLFLSPTFHPERQETCVDLLTPEQAEDTHVVGVTYTKSAENWLAAYRRHSSTEPAQMTVISIGERSRSTATAPSQSAPGVPRIETINSASDLTELGIKISTILEQHKTSKWSDGASELVLCYDSLTSMLQFVEKKRAFHFLHVMTNRLSQFGAMAHYHLDPDAFDQQTVSTLKSVFDAIVQPDDDGGWVVQQR